MHNNKFGFSGALLLGSYLISLALAPLFHLHLEKHHHPTTDAGYHSHAQPFASPSPKHNETSHHKDRAVEHFGQAFSAFEGMVGEVQVSQNKIFNPSQFTPVAELIIISSGKNHPVRFSQKDTFQTPLPQPAQDYCVLSATNLSPPQV